MADYSIKVDFPHAAPAALHIHLPSGVDLNPVLDAIHTLTHVVDTQGAQMVADLSELMTAVAEVQSVGDSAIALLQGLAAKLAEMAQQTTVNPADLQALADQLHADSAELADAVTANTPAA